MTDLPSTFSGAPDQRLWSELIADGYRTASLAGTNMARVVEAVEPLRVPDLRFDEPFSLARRIGRRVGLADGEDVQSVLSGMRLRFLQALSAHYAATVADAYRSSAEEGRRTALRLYAGALLDGPASVLAAIAGSLPPHEPDCERLRQWTSYVRREIWRPLHALFLYLAEADAGIPQKQRAALFAFAAQVHLFQSRRPDLARDLLDRANRIDPEEYDVLRTHGHFWSVKEDPVKAAFWYGRAIEAKPGEPQALCDWGELEMQQDRLEAAEEKFSQALQLAPEYAGGYVNLIQLYGKPRWFAERKHHLHSLFRRAVATDAESEYRACLSMAEVYQQNDLSEVAQEWCDRAIAAIPDAQGGYIAKATYLLDRAEFDAAREQLLHAVAAAPEIDLGYWHIAASYERQKRWADSARWYEEARSRATLDAGYLGARAVLMRWRLGEDVPAEAAILEALQQDSSVLDLALDFADALYKEQDQPEAALRVLSRIREIKGESYEPQYRNRTGHVFYWQAQYETAAEHYRAAALADPSNSRYLKNVGLALREQRDWDGARAAFAEAAKVDAVPAECEHELGTTYNLEGNAEFERSEFEAAAECYRRAAQYLPRDAVVHSNVALALERLLPASSKPAALLDEITSELKMALEISSKEEYQERLSRMELRSKQFRVYGRSLFKQPWTTPIVVEVSDALVPIVDSRQDGGHFLFTLIPELRSRVRRDFAMTLPGIRMRGNPNLTSGAYRVLLHEVEAAHGSVSRGVFVTVAENGAAPALFDEVRDPLTGKACRHVEEDEAQRLRATGTEVWDDAQFLLRHIESVLRRFLHVLAGIQDLAKILPEGDEDDPAANAVLADPNLRADLMRLLRALMRDGVRFREPARIAAAVNPEHLRSGRFDLALESARLACREDLPGNGPDDLRVPLPDALEEELERLYPDGFRPPGAEARHRMLTEVAALCSPNGRPVGLIVRSGEQRALLQRLIDYALPEVSVLTRGEARLMEGSEHGHA